MFWFHEDGTETSDSGLRVDFGGILPGILWKKAHGDPGEREMEVVFGSFVEDLLRKRGRGIGCRGPNGPEQNVQLRRKGWDNEVRRFAQVLMQFYCSRVAGL